VRLEVYRIIFLAQFTY